MEQQNQAPFTVPYDVIELPSKGALYPGKKSSLKVQYLTASDENILTSPNLLQSGEWLNVLFDRKIVDKEINHKDLLIGDRNAIMIWLRATGLGEDYPFSVIDPNTGEEFETSFNLNDLKQKGLGAQPDENGHFDFELPKSKKKLKFRLLTARDEDEITKRESQLNKAKAQQFSDSVTYKLAKQVISIDGNTDPMQINQFVQMMPLLDAKAFRQYSESIEPGIDMKISVQTPGGGSIDTFLPIGLNFFWPELDL